MLRMLLTECQKSENAVSSRTEVLPGNMGSSTKLEIGIFLNNLFLHSEVYIPIYFIVIYHL